jgi:hypothetical protein
MEKGEDKWLGYGKVWEKIRWSHMGKFFKIFLYGKSMEQGEDKWLGYGNVWKKIRSSH